MTGQHRFKNLERAAIWLLLAAATAYRALHMRPAVSERIRAAGMNHRSLRIAGLLWIPISRYWEIQARNAEADANAEPGVSRGLPVFLVNAALLLLFIPVPRLNGRWIRASPFVIAAGLAIEICAAFLAVWSRRALGRNGSGRATIKYEHRLISCVSGEWHALTGLVLAALAYWRKIRVEEENLAAHFGIEWSDYLGSTGSLVPGVR